MTKHQYHKEIDRIFKRFNIVDNHVDTLFGSLYVRADKIHNVNLYSVFMRFEDDFDINIFYEFFSKHENINPHSKKWNLHSEDAEYILNELEERLDNLEYLLLNHGKVGSKGFKMTL